MTVLAPPEPGTSPRQIPLDVEIVVPVYNEAPHLAERVTELRRFLDQSFPFRALVTVVDNASTDETFALASRARRHHAGGGGRAPAPEGPRAMRSARPGRPAPPPWWPTWTSICPPRSPRSFPWWRRSCRGSSDVAIGTRLARGAHVVRGPKRELISRAYNLLLKLSLRGRFSDAQCGFKALRRESALQLLPLIKDDEWFFDTELLVTAERLGLRISEVPVDWVDDPDSRVQIFRTALNDLRGRVADFARPRPAGLALGSRPARRRAPSARWPPISSCVLPAWVPSAPWGTSSSSSRGAQWPGPSEPTRWPWPSARSSTRPCTESLRATCSGPAHRGRLVLVATGLFAISLTLTTLALMAAPRPVGILSRRCARRGDAGERRRRRFFVSPFCGPGSSDPIPPSRLGPGG